MAVRSLVYLCLQESLEFAADCYDRSLFNSTVHELDGYSQRNRVDGTRRLPLEFNAGDYQS